MREKQVEIKGIEGGKTGGGLRWSLACTDGMRMMMMMGGEGVQGVGENW